MGEGFKIVMETFDRTRAPVSTDFLWCEVCLTLECCVFMSGAVTHSNANIFYEQCTCSVQNALCRRAFSICYDSLILKGLNEGGIFGKMAAGLAHLIM